MLSLIIFIGFCVGFHNMQDFPIIARFDLCDGSTPERKAICDVISECGQISHNDVVRCTYLAVLCTVENNKYVPRGVGVGYDHEYIITTVSSGFTDVYLQYKNYSWVYFMGNTIYLMQNQSGEMTFIQHNFDSHGWNDIMLIKFVSNHETSKFYGGWIPFEADSVKEESNASRTGFIIKDNKLQNVKDIEIYNTKTCRDMFAYDGHVFFDENSMWCQTDGNIDKPPPPELMPWLSGLPVIDYAFPRRYFVGIRSLQSNDPYHRGAFLVVKIDHFCPWLQFHTKKPCTDINQTQADGWES